MIKINQILKNFIILKLVFILIGLFLSRAENSLDEINDCCDNLVQNRIELVFSVEPEYDKILSELDNPEQQPSVLNHSHCVFSILYKFKLNLYHIYIRHQLKSYKYSFDKNCQIIMLPYKYNIWHKSSCEDPVFFS